MNEIETRGIGKIILNELTPKRNPRYEHFLIPYYQRGYRWESRHVKALLRDIDNFMLSGEDNYCLQPIVVILSLDDAGLNIWEVIDGQQRLITLSIIFRYISKASYSLIFEKRAKSTDFLTQLSADTLSHQNPDFHFMSEAYKTVKKWFDKKAEHDISYIDEFYTTITKKVQVIWYKLADLDDKGKIDIFNRFNIGKIPLSDAELIRALLLSKIKFGLPEREANMRQAEISAEWNVIEHELQKDELWYFLTNQTKTEYSSRIEYIFNIIAGEKAKDYSTYLWFEREIRDVEEEIEAEKAFKLWRRTKEIFAKFKSWYNKPRLYHMVGFLLANHHPIHDILEQSITSKPKFVEWLEDEVRANVGAVDLESLSYGDGNSEKLFLLFNILTVDRLAESINNRFPFNHYKKTKYELGGWSIEHIHAQRSEPMKDEKAIRTWLDETLKAIENIPYIEVNTTVIDEEGNVAAQLERKDINDLYVERIKKMKTMEKVDVNLFNILKDELIVAFDSSSVHDFGNLALLSKKDNSALNNSIFPVKRNKIIALEREGKFIPPCTRNVFLKFYSNSDSQPYYWSSSDKTSYFDSMTKVFDSFLKKN